MEFVVFLEDDSFVKDAEEDAKLLKDSSVVLQVAVDLSQGGMEDDDDDVLLTFLSAAGC